MSSKKIAAGTKFRVILITQDDPFFLADSFTHFFNVIPDSVHIAGCVLLSPSPFGKKESFLKKSLKTISIFGFRFFSYYAIKFVLGKLGGSRSVRRVMESQKVTMIELDKSINHPQSLDAISALKPDLLISVAGNEIFKKALIEMAPKGCLNLHSALLPKYRGLMPSFWVLKNREATSGVSVFYVDEGIDTGPIIVQKEIAIAGMSQRELIIKSKELGMEAVAEALHKIIDGDSSTITNSDSDATYFRFPTSNDVKDFRYVGARFF
jgi:methionyl-tRNA formyltransferase